MAKLHAWTSNYIFYLENFDLSKKLIFGSIAILKEFLPDDDE